MEYNGYWIFLNNPRKWDVQKCLEDHLKNSFNLKWKIKESQSKYFKIGQLGILRVGTDQRNKNELAGRKKLDSGIYAIVQVVNNPEKDIINNSEYFEYFNTEKDSEEKTYRVEVKIIKNLVNNPILLKEIINIPEIINDPYLIKGLQMSTIPLSEKAYLKIIELTETFDIKKENIEYSPFQELNKFEKESIVKIRIGQSSFKQNLINLYGKCCICGLKHPNFLIASHIKPWSMSSDTEKLDKYNGLLLCPHHDSLFDKGYISFDNEGKIMISKNLSKMDKILLNIRDDMFIKMQENNQVYMKWHREHIFK